MLDLDTCKRMKEKGYPQGEDTAGTFWYRAEEYYDEYKDPCDDEIIAACPNSDELLAEIVKLGWGVSVENTHLPDDWLALATRWIDDEMRWETENTVNAIGPTPVAALAELWIALKERGKNA